MQQSKHRPVADGLSSFAGEDCRYLYGRHEEEWLQIKDAALEEVTR